MTEKVRRVYFKSTITGNLMNVSIRYSAVTTAYVPALRQISEHQYNRIAAKYAKRAFQRVQP